MWAGRVCSFRSEVGLKIFVGCNDEGQMAALRFNIVAIDVPKIPDWWWGKEFWKSGA